MKYSWKIFVAAMAASMALATASFAANFDIPGGSLKSALNAYATQTGIPLIYLDQDLDSAHSKGVKGDLSNYDALSRILAGTGFAAQRHPSGSVGIVRTMPTSDEAPLLKAAAATAPTGTGASL
ncbi:MAG TPA: STN domain-containing protein, partial [Rhizomicrobium sp.]